MEVKKFNIKAMTGRLLLVVFAAVFMSGCVQENSLCPPDRGPLVKKGMTLNFTLLTRSINKSDKTRALIPAPDPQDGSAAENYLDVSNMTFLIFKQDGSLLTTFSPEVTPENTQYTRYDVSYSVPETLFDYVTGDFVNIYIMAIGNTGNFSALPDLDNMFAKSSSFNFPLRGNTISGGSFLWTPDVDAKRGIPMSGMQYFSIPRTALENSSSENPLNLSRDMGSSSKDLNMLRCMAKVEVIDMIGEVGSNIITQVSLTGFNDRGRILPTFDQWQIQTPWETQYVAKTSVPESVVFNAASPILFFKDEAATAIRPDRRAVYSTFLTEFNHTAAGVTIPQVSVQLNIGTTAAPVTETRSFGLTSYQNGASTNEATDLLRNNIYRYELRLNMNQELVVTVCPRAEFTTDVPTFE